MTTSRPGDAVARDRVEAVLERLDHVSLAVVVVAAPDAIRLAARERARVAAIAAGRSVLLEDASKAAHGATLQAFARAGFSGTWAASEWSVSVATAHDRAAAAAALEEAAIAGVVEDLVDEETIAVLRATWDELERSSGIPSPGALSAVTAPVAAVGRGRLAVVAAVVLVGAGLFASGTVAGLIPLAAGAAIIANLARRRGRNAEPDVPDANRA